MDIYVKATGISHGRSLLEILQTGFQERFFAELRFGIIEVVEVEDAKNNQNEDVESE